MESMNMEALKLESPEGSWDTLFLKDTCQLKSSPAVIGTICKTWHDLDDIGSWGEDTDCVAGSIATGKEMDVLRRTGQPPRHYAVFEPRSQFWRRILVHESEVRVLDRPLVFGEVVKRGFESSVAGTVISVSTEVDLKQSFQNPSNPISLITGATGRELCLVHEWNSGDIIVYDNCWMAAVREVVDDVAIRLGNGSVVIPEDSRALNIPILTREEELAVQQDMAFLTSGGAGITDLPGDGSEPRMFRRPGGVQSPAYISPGDIVTSSKGNLRRGKWVFGAYDPNVLPTGVVVDVKTAKLGVEWLCQNLAVSGLSVPAEKPNIWLEFPEDLSLIRKFSKSTGGFVNLDGKPYKANEGGGLQIEDKVRFRDLSDAVVKYPGGVTNIARSETMGFDINVFGISSISTRVRVLWQDLTETTDDAKNLIPYLNVDEYELWPGDIVMLKLGSDEPAPLPAQEAISSPVGELLPRGICSPELPAHVFCPSASAVRVSPSSPQTQKRLGVVQSANSAMRVANVRWFENSNVEFTEDHFLTPTSTTGRLGDQSDVVSVYEVSVIQSLATTRGDIVLVYPSQNATPGSGVDRVLVGGHEGAHDQIHHLHPEGLNWERERIDMPDGSLLINLSAALGGSSSPQFQEIGRLLNQIPLSTTSQRLPASPRSQNSSRPRTPYEEPRPEPPPIDWVGEVVDLGLDGLVTVRLGAMDDTKDVRIESERAHLLFSATDMDDFPDGEEFPNFGDFQGQSDAGSNWSTLVDAGVPAGGGTRSPISQAIIYEGGERLDSGDEDEWLTDDAEDDMELDSDSPSESTAGLNFLGDNAMEVEGTNLSPRNTRDGAQTTAVGCDRGKGKGRIDVPAPPQHDPSLHRSMPVLEAFSFPPTSSQPARFAVLDDPVPHDHAFAGRAPTPSESTFLRRMHQEHKILSTSLPDGIVVRTWESRIDLVRVLIIGPINTPYALAPFFFDFYFPPTFPQAPPIAHFHSWTGGIGRVNPNLYEDGRVCLSLLGTWHAEKKNEAWSAGSSTVLQVLVSLMGLVLVSEPYYNEAGFDIYAGAKEVSLASSLYSERAYILSRGFVKRVLQIPMPGFEKEIKWLYLPNQAGGLGLLDKVVKSTNEVVQRSESEEPIDEKVETKEGVGKVSAGAVVMLKRALESLEGIMAGK